MDVDNNNDVSGLPWFLNYLFHSNNNYYTEYYVIDSLMKNNIEYISFQTIAEW